MKSIRVRPAMIFDNEGPWNGLNQLQLRARWLEGAFPMATRTRATTANTMRMITSTERRTRWILAAIISTVLLLVIYFIVTLGAQAFAGVGKTGIGLANPDNYSDVFSSLGSAVFGHSTIGSIAARLLILLVLTSATASTQTTILPTARTTLSMAVYK